MGDRKETKVSVRIIHAAPDEITTSCKHCGEAVHSTKYAILLIDGRRKFIFLSDTPVECCDDDVDVPLQFDDEESAMEAQRKIVDILRRERNTNSFQLQDVTDEDSLETKH